MTDKNGVELERTPVKPGKFSYNDACPAGDEAYDPAYDEEKKRAREIDTSNRGYYSGV